MVTFKRDATSTEERYGGYASRLNNRMSDYDRTRSFGQGNRTSYSTYIEDRAPTQYYTDLRESISPAQMCGNPATMQRTMNTNVMRQINPVGVRKIAKPRLNKKAKCLVALYAIVVVALAVFTAINLASISKLNGEIAVAEQSLATTTQALANEQSVLDAKEEELMAQAMEAGYTAPIASGTYTIVDTVNTNNEVVQTNWFDSVCTFISNIFGG